MNIQTIGLKQVNPNDQPNFCAEFEYLHCRMSDIQSDRKVSENKLDTLVGRRRANHGRAIDGSKLIQLSLKYSSIPPSCTINDQNIISVDRAAIRVRA